MAFDFLMLKKTISDVNSQFSKATGQLEKLKQRRDLVVAAPATKEDVIAILHARIDAESDAYPARLRDGLHEYIAKGQLHDLKTHNLHMLMPGHANYGGAVGDTGTLFSRLAYFLREPFKESISEAIMGMEDWPEGSISHKDKQAELARLEKDIESLESEIQSMKQEAARAGMFLR